MGAGQTCQLKSPQTTNEFLDHGSEIMLDMSTLLNSEGWSQFHNTENVTVESKQIEGSYLPALKGSVVLKGSNFSGLTSKLFNPTFEERKRVYDEVISEKVLQIIDDDNIVVLTQFAAPWPVYPREFLVLKSRKRINKDNQLITAQSIDYPTVPQSSGFVRGIVRTGMMVSNLGNNQIKVTKVDHIDPQGAIPTEIVKAKQIKSAYRLDAMQGYLNE